MAAHNYLEAILRTQSNIPQCSISGMGSILQCKYTEQESKVTAHNALAKKPHPKPLN